jgi:predicted phosphodiesterase
MRKIKLWALVSVMMALFIVFSACDGDNNGNGNGGKNEPPDVTTVAPRFITNNFGQDSSGELLVQWHNDTNISRQALQIVEESGSFDSAAVRSITVTGVTWNPTRTPANQDVGNYPARNIFRAEVKDLTPGTQYKYRVGNEGAWSDTFYHLTSGGGANTNFSFTVGADTQSVDFTGMTRTFRAANEFDEDNRFFLIAGDIVNYPQENPNEFVNFTNAANEFNVRTPIVTTQGNHDTYINSGTGNRDHYQFGSAEVFNSFITFPDNGWDQGAFHGPHRSKSYYFYYNNVLIVMLNTMATQNATGPSEPNHTAQANWLREILEYDRTNNLSRYRIIVTHFPVFSGRENERWLTPGVRRAYAKIATDFDVDIFFSGHDHVYVRSNPIKFSVENPQLTAANFPETQGGTIFTIPAGTGTRLDDWRVPAANLAFHEHIYPFRHAGTAINPGVFVNIKVTDAKMIVTAMTSANPPVELDRYEITPKR